MSDELQRIVDAVASAVPSACFAALGWIAHHLALGKARMSWRKFLGGVMLAGFTGGATCALLLQSGIHPELAAIIASVIGSNGSRGYEWLVQRSKDSINKE